MVATIYNLTEKIVPILKKHEVKRAGLFGSVVSGNATIESDIDLLVELDNGSSLFDFLEIKFELEQELEKKVDLVEYCSIKKSLKLPILSSEVRIYG
jgi:predicted nucleotidyltransferase